MAKKKKQGRPIGPEKEPLNLFVHKELAASLRELAKKEQRTISVVVENAIRIAYEI